MKKVIKKFSTVFIVFLLLTMTTSNIISYAADENKEYTSPNALLSFSQALQANDVNSTFTASWNGTHSSMVIKNQLPTSNYVMLSITALSSSGTCLGTIPYNGVIGSGISHTLYINQPNTALFQISAKMFIGNSPSGVAISDWSANININNNSITIQGNDGNSQVSITKNNNAVYLSMLNSTVYSHFTNLNITEYSSGTIVNSTSHNSILLPNNSYTIVGPNSINTFQLSAQMWNNTTPTGTPLSNWTATA